MFKLYNNKIQAREGGNRLAIGHCSGQPIVPGLNSKNVYKYVLLLNIFGRKENLFDKIIELNRLKKSIFKLFLLVD